MKVKREVFLMNKIHTVTIEGIIGSTIDELFDEVQKFKSLCEEVNLDFNGIVVNAGIYETSDQLANSIFAVSNGDKEKIVSNLPSNESSLTIGFALELMDDQMKRKGFEGFSKEEIIAIASTYNGKKLENSQDQKRTSLLKHLYYLVKNNKN